MKSGTRSEAMGPPMRSRLSDVSERSSDEYPGG